MNCDVHLLIGKKENPIIIAKESSSKELDSYADIADYILNNNTFDRNDLKESLTSASKIDNIKDKIKDFENLELMTEVSFKDLADIAGNPEIEEKLESFGNKYNIIYGNLIYSGKEVSGKVIIHGSTYYFLKNKKAIKNFVNNEEVKYLIKQKINENVLTDDNLRTAYQLDLKAIAKKHIDKDGNPLSISKLIEDFIDNKSAYEQLYGKQFESDILESFCRTLQGQEIFNYSSPLFKRLQALNNQFGQYRKGTPYEFQKDTFFKELKALNLIDISLSEFNKLSSEEVITLIQNIFDQIPGFSGFKVLSIGNSAETEIPINNHTMQSIVKKIREANNEASKEERKKNKAIKKDTTTLSDLTTLAQAQKYLKEARFDGQEIIIKEEKNSDGAVVGLKYYYKGHEYSKYNKIRIAYNWESLGSRFDFGYDEVKKFFEAVNEKDIKDGRYLGYYVYKHINENQEPIFVVSDSIISPELYSFKEFYTAEEAQRYIDNKVNSKNYAIKNSININLALAKNKGNSREIFSSIPANQGQALSIINYPFTKSSIALNTDAGLLLNSNFKDAKQILVDNSINIDSITSPQQIAILAYAMSEQDLTFSNADDINKIKELLNTIIESEEKYYLVESSNKTKYGNVLKIKYLNPTDVKMSSLGDLDNKPYRTYSKTNALNNIKEALETKMFKGTGISIKIIGNSEVEQLSEQDKVSIDPHARAFIYNNTIYINQENADVSDLIHETMHIALAMIRIKNEEVYSGLLNYFYDKVSPYIKRKIDQVYKGFALQDRMEEAVVHYLSEVEYKDFKYFTDETTDGELQVIGNEFKEAFKIINEAKNADPQNDISFGGFAQLMSGNLKKMSEYHALSNLVKKGIDEEVIKEKCE